MRHLLLLPVLLGLTACGNTLTRTEAINEAALAVCDYNARCDEIGEGEDKAYPNRDACMVDQRAFFQNVWGFDACEENINQEGFDQCLTRIGITQCGNLLDFANAILNCTEGRVCGGNTEA